MTNAIDTGVVDGARHGIAWVIVAVWFIICWVIGAASAEAGIFTDLGTGIIFGAFAWLHWSASAISTDLAFFAGDLCAWIGYALAIFADLPDFAEWAGQ